MKRFILIFLVISLSLYSCHTPSYSFDRTSSRYFKIEEGKYLLNTIKAPEAVRLDMQEKIMEKFEDQDIIILQKASVNIYPSEIPIHPTPEIIKQLKETAGDFDYIINVIAEKESEDVSSMQIGNLDPSDKNVVHVTMEIINLNNQASAFYARVRSELSDNNDNKDFSLAVDANSMLRKSLKKILKRIEKKN